LGTCVGPLVSPILSRCTGLVEVRIRSADSGYATALVWAFMFIFSLVFLPRDMEPILDEVRRRRSDDVQNKEEVSDMPVQQRRSIWWSGVFFTAERSFTIPALEAAAIFVLEEEFGWRAQESGFAVGLTFLTLLPSTSLLMWIKAKKLASDTSLLKCVVSLGAVVTILFFPIKGAQAALATTLLLVTDCIVFSAGFASEGAMNGFATNQCEGIGSFYSTSNYILATQTIRVVPRALSPVVSRYIISAHGRAMYAGVQFLIASMGCLSCFYVAAPIEAQRELSAEKKASASPTN